MPDIGCSNISRVPRPTLRFVMLLLVHALTACRVARTDDFSAVFLPQTDPIASSIDVSIAAPVVGAATDTSSLEGTATLIVSPTLENWGDAQLTDVELILVDGMDFSLLGGALTARAEPGAARVRMLESGAAGPIVDGRFDQLENLFQFEGEIYLSTEPEPYDLSTVAPMPADLLGIELTRFDDGVRAALTVDLEFVAAIAAPPLGQIPLTITFQAQLHAIAPLNGSADVDSNGHVDSLDIDALHAAIRRQESDPRFDLNDDGMLDPADARLWIQDLMYTNYGDADLNQRFDSSDLIAVLASGTYADAIPLNSLWAEGDWNGDGESDSADLVLALQESCYETCNGPRAAVAAVPEPGGLTLVSSAVFALMGRNGRDRRIRARRGRSRCPRPRPATEYRSA